MIIRAKLMTIHVLQIYHFFSKHFICHRNTLNILLSYTNFHEWNMNLHELYIKKIILQFLHQHRVLRSTLLLHIT